MQHTQQPLGISAHALDRRITMASVRMTHELRNQIRRNAEAAYETANPEPKPSTALVEATKTALYNSTKQQFLRQMHNKAQEMGIHGQEEGSTYMPIVKADVAEIEVKTRDLNSTTHRNFTGFHLRFATPVTMLRAPNNTSWYSPTLYVTDCSAEDITEYSEQVSALCSLRDKYWDDKRTYETSIRELLEKCNTLKQLLEVWPAAESLCPSEKLQQMHVKVTRAERAQTIKEQVSFDPTVANQAVLTAKLMGG